MPTDAQTSACLLHHWHAAIGNSSRTPARRAFCLLGQTRLFGLSAFNLAWAFGFPENPVDIFFVGPADASYRLHRGLIAELVADAFTYDENQTVLNLSVSTPLWTLNGSRLVLNAAHARRLGFALPGGRVQQRMLNMAIQCWQQQQCARLVTSHEQRRGVKYETVARMRPDGYFWQRAPASQRPAVMTWSYGQDFYFYGERDAGLAMLRSLERLVEPYLRGEHSLPAGSDALVIQLWDYTLDQLQANGTSRLVVHDQYGGKEPIFIGKVSGDPVCAVWTTMLERPDPEGFGGFGSDSWRHKVPPVPDHVTATMEQVGHKCLGVRRVESASKCQLLSPTDALTWAMGDPGRGPTFQVGGTGSVSPSPSQRHSQPRQQAARGGGEITRRPGG